jgi:hypothetical protein
VANSLSVSESFAPRAALPEPGLDAAYPEVYSNSFDSVSILGVDDEFGDIATDRTSDSEANAAAEDVVFDLLGAGAF